MLENNMMLENNIRKDLVNKKWGVPVPKRQKQLGELGSK